MPDEPAIQRVEVSIVGRAPAMQVERAVGVNNERWKEEVRAEAAPLREEFA